MVDFLQQKGGQNMIIVTKCDGRKNREKVGSSIRVFTSVNELLAKNSSSDFAYL